MFIPDHGFCFYPTKATKEGKRIGCPTFFAATNITKFKTILFLNRYSVVVLFTQKIVTKLSKIWVGDSGYEIRDPEKPFPDLGIKKHRIPDPDPPHCLYAPVCPGLN
jgi:hypothetical protein